MSLRHLLYNRLPNNTMFRNAQRRAARCAKVWVGVLGKHIICVCGRCVSNKCVWSVQGGAVWVSHQNLIETVCFLQSFLRVKHIQLCQSFWERMFWVFQGGPFDFLSGCPSASWTYVGRTIGFEIAEVWGNSKKTKSCAPGPWPLHFFLTVCTSYSTTPFLLQPPFYSPKSCVWTVSWLAVNCYISSPSTSVWNFSSEL